MRELDRIGIVRLDKQMDLARIQGPNPTHLKYDELVLNKDAAEVKTENKANCKR